MTTQDPTQRRANLDKANNVRTQRAAVKRLLYAADNKADSLVLLARILAENPPVIQTATLYDLLMSCRQTGRVYTRQTLRELGVNTSTRVCDLTDVRRAKTIAHLKAEAARR